MIDGEKKAITRLAMELGAKCFIVLIALFVIGIIQFFRNGLVDETIIILAGSLLSTAQTFLLVSLLSINIDETEVLPSKMIFYWIMSATVLLLYLVPWAFSCYLVFYDGIWLLIKQFSFLSLTKSIVLVPLGWLLVNYYSKITDIDVLISRLVRRNRKHDRASG